MRAAIPFGGTVEQGLAGCVSHASLQSRLTAAAVLTLALGIGANTVLFTVIYMQRCFGALPYPEAGKLVKFYERLADGGKEADSRGFG